MVAGSSPASSLDTGLQSDAGTNSLVDPGRSDRMCGWNFSRGIADYLGRC